jgi:hypothetical protein
MFSGDRRVTFEFRTDISESCFVSIFTENMTILVMTAEKLSGTLTANPNSTRPTAKEGFDRFFPSKIFKFFTIRWQRHLHVLNMKLHA